MTENISKLIELFEHGRTNIGRIDYENPAHLEFVTNVFGALKNAVPEIRVLSEVQPKVASIQLKLDRVFDVISHRLPLTTHGPNGSIGFDVLSVTHAPAPNNGALPEPQMERSTHTQEESRNTGGTAEAPDHKSDTSDTPAPAAATPLDAARKAAAASKTPSGRAPRKNAKPKVTGAPQQ